MKREIYCLDCNKLTIPSYDRDNIEHLKDRIQSLEFQIGLGEKEKRIYGKLIRHVYCDRCMKKLSSEDNAVAYSNYTKQTPYYEWESEFLNVGA